MKIEILNRSNYIQYNNFLLSFENTLLYSSVKYKELLEEYTGCDAVYLIVKENDEIVGVLPLMIYKNIKYGNVCNSLPFYGSNGGIIIFEDSRDIKKILIDEYKKILKDYDCIAGTIITSPFEPNLEFYHTELNYDYIDKRIGQITFLPDNESLVMDKIHSKTRNMIRKAIKADIRVEVCSDNENFTFLYETHLNNMEKIGGIPKPLRFFELVKKHFEKQKDYKIFTAYMNDKPIAALLNFYFNKTVEYFTPVTVTEYREFQPLSLLIYEAMRNAVYEGYRNWNWGGTWLTQEGVYEFKRKWGTVNLDYYYFTTLRDKLILNLKKEDILKEYPNLFVLPFSVLDFNYDETK